MSWSLCFLFIVIQSRGTSLAECESDTTSKRLKIDGSALRVAVDFGNKFGGGVVLNSDGVVLTCNHVIKGFVAGRVEFQTREQMAFNVIYSDEDSDIALLLLETPVECEQLKLRENSSLLDAEPLVSKAPIIGGPIATIVGTVSYKATDETSGKIVAQLPMTHGSSGSPVFDKSGSLVGIVVGSVGKTESFTRLYSNSVIEGGIREASIKYVEMYLGKTRFAESVQPVVEETNLASLLKGDEIHCINSERVNSTLDICTILLACGHRGKAQVVLGIKRQGEVSTVILTPQTDDSDR